VRLFLNCNFMDTLDQKKSQQKTKEILELFAPVEGFNTVYYGKVRNGKTFAATMDILEKLSRGGIVYANWEINFDDFDERNSKAIVLVKLLFGRRHFFVYKKENFHYFSPDDVDVAFLGRLVGVDIYIDEGQWLFNSHVREKADDPSAVEKRKLILHGGHYCRSLNVITQRPTNLFKDVRSQINIWYKCVKRFHFGRLILFQRWEFQDMKNDEPDEELPAGRPKTYFATKKMFNSYNTHSMRSKDAIEPDTAYEVYSYSFWGTFKLLCGLLRPKWSKPRPRAQ